MVNDFWLKNKHTISIFHAQVRDLAKHIEAQPKQHNAYKKKTCIVIAGCPCHILHNAASKAATAFISVCGFDFEDIVSTFPFGLINQRKENLHEKLF